MRVAVYYSNSDLRIEERPTPAIGAGELLVRVEASGICGTDCLEWYRAGRVRLVLGHEIAGVVAKAGRSVRRFKAGDRVAVSHHVPCGECAFCRSGHETVCDTLRGTNFDPGGFSEFIRVPEINVNKGTYLIPEGVSFEEATFTEPLACVLRGQRLAGMSKGKSVLVIGSGISGLLHVKLAKFYGAKMIAATDMSRYRIEAAKRCGADLALSVNDYAPERLKDSNGGRLADIVIICAGSAPAFEQGLRSIERGGTALIFAATEKGVLLPVPINDIFWRNEVTITSSYAGSPADHLEALEKIASKKIRVCDMITHRIPLEDIGEGFRLVADAKESMKIIVEPQR